MAGVLRSVASLRRGHRGPFQPTPVVRRVAPPLATPPVARRGGGGAGAHVRKPLPPAAEPRRATRRRAGARVMRGTTVLASPDARPEGIPPAAGWSFRRVWFLAFLALTGLGCLWNLAQPPLSGGDEIAQVIYAQAVVTGQWNQPLQSTSRDGFNPDVLPKAQFITPSVTDPVGNPFCYMAKAAIPASCDQVTGKARWQKGDFQTYVAHYPILPYLLTGGPLGVSPSTFGLYLARALN